MSLSTATPPSQARIPAIDAARGCALLGMFAFHLTWDLAFFGFVSPSAPFSPAMMAFGHCVAISFLALAGASLVLASRGGMNWAAYRRRLAVVAAAAGVITLATLLIFPDEFIFFGILHCIAAASVLALAFLRGPPWLALAAAAAMAITPLFVAVPALDNIFGWSLGLSAHQPRTNDWRPLLPWAGATIAGTGLMRMVLARGVPKSVASWDAGNVATRALTWGGRHSLLVYLVHQPVFLGVVYLAALAAPPSESPAVAEESGFQTSCVAACAPSGASSGVCEALCECVSEATRTAGLWRPMMDSKLTPAQSLRVDEITRQCAPSREGAGARRPLENQ